MEFLGGCKSRLLTGFGQKDYKFITPKPRNRIRSSRGIKKTIRHRLQKTVSFFVTFLIVHNLETIQIHVCNRQGVAVSSRPFYFQVSSFKKGSSVGKSGKRIFVSQLFLAIERRFQLAENNRH